MRSSPAAPAGSAGRLPPGSAPAAAGSWSSTAWSRKTRWTNSWPWTSRRSHRAGARAGARRPASRGWPMWARCARRCSREPRRFRLSDGAQRALGHPVHQGAGAGDACGRLRAVNVSSRSVRGKELRTNYAATKAALIGLTRTWALELGACGITVHLPRPDGDRALCRGQPAGFGAPGGCARRCCGRREPRRFRLSDGAQRALGHPLKPIEQAGRAAGLPTICKGSLAGSGCPPWRMRILVFAVTRFWLRRLGNVVWLSSIAQATASSRSSTSPAARCAARSSAPTTPPPRRR